ncbi:MAG: pyridoxamine 5'-phosphate oxidase [Lysobacteraceae bacterium]|nr:MAG: pyridoxamine 5'-phosphate oxidase [Xanthomonadaceae bacterium]
MTDLSANPAVDPLYQEALATFGALLEDARAAADPEPTAMTLATAVGTRVSARIVLLKGFDPRGFRFFTNFESDKGTQLAAQPFVALCFHWKTLRSGVQVRVEGRASRLPDAESDAYFATRPRGSQLGAWASAQSRTLDARATFEQRLAEVERRFDGTEVTRPSHWGGHVVAPVRIEFWYGADFRLHERQCYELADGRWTRRMLYP